MVCPFPEVLTSRQAEFGRSDQNMNTHKLCTEGTIGRAAANSLSAFQGKWPLRRVVRWSAHSASSVSFHSKGPGAFLATNHHGQSGSDPLATDFAQVLDFSLFLPFSPLQIRNLVAVCEDSTIRNQ